jgi:hypothetical protein
MAGAGAAMGSVGAAYFVLSDIHVQEEALASLRSLRAQMPGLPATIYTDVADTSFLAPFDAVVPLELPSTYKLSGPAPWAEPAWLPRIDCIAAMPYERTLFVDADTVFVRSVADVFETLERFDVAAAHAAFRYREVIPGIPPSFPEYNCGVLAFRRSAATSRLVAAWRTHYLADRAHWDHDQQAFRKALWESELRIATLPPEYNLRPRRHAGRDAPRLLHGFSRGARQQPPRRRKVRLLSADHGMSHHRSGWIDVTLALQTLTHPNGILFDTVIENTFGWHEAMFSNYLPIREPWIGISHNPPNIPAGTFDAVRMPTITRKKTFQESLGCCLGLFTLSRYHAEALRRTTNVPVDVLYHPADYDVPKFSLELFNAAERPRLLHVGWWLRRFETFARLKAPGYAKELLMVEDRNATAAVEAVQWGDDVAFTRYVPHAEFDRLMQSSVVFVDLVDTSANNVVLDCIGRGTPLVINRHPAIEEYLGPDYPLFYKGREEAEWLLADRARIVAGAEYLRARLGDDRLTMKSFVDSIVHSPIYRALTPC